jgi:hypothetical protein
MAIRRQQQNLWDSGCERCWPAGAARSLGHALRRVGPLQQARAISKRLKKFRECRALPGADLDALTQFVTVMGFMFGFMRPAVLRQDRKSATKTATTIAKLLVRALPSFPISHNGRQMVT